MSVVVIVSSWISRPVPHSSLHLADRLDFALLNELTGTIPTELALIGSKSSSGTYTAVLSLTFESNVAYLATTFLETPDIEINFRFNSLTGTVPTEILGMRGLSKYHYCFEIFNVLLLSILS